MTGWGLRKYLRARRKVFMWVFPVVQVLFVLLNGQDANSGRFLCVGSPGGGVKCIFAA